jgi:sarcosine oxidase
MLDRAALNARFPQFTGLDAHDAAYYEPGAGFVYPEACIRVQLEAAEREGATILRNTAVTGIVQGNNWVRIETAAGAIEAEYAVVAAGAWVAKLLGAPFDRLLRPTRQVLHWFEADEPGLYTPEKCPTYIRHYAHGGGHVYGFPTPHGATGVKIAEERRTAWTDPDARRLGVTGEDIATFHAHFVAGKFAGVSPRLTAVKTCMYTEAPGVNFLIDQHPEMDRVTVISACSGHGFKHSAGIGDAVAERMRQLREMGHTITQDWVAVEDMKTMAKKQTTKPRRAGPPRRPRRDGLARPPATRRRRRPRPWSPAAPEARPCR